jgi:glycosyltransferase involved in cell wall biosynthesis
MKVLHVVPALGSIYGGSTTAILELAESLAKLGVQTDIVTTNANGRQALDVPLQTWIQDRGYRIQYFPCWYLKDYKLSPALSQWLFRHVRDYDIVNTHAMFSIATLPAYWACQRYGIPYVIHPHGMLETWALSYKSWKKQPYYTLIEKPALERASVIRVLATPEAENIKGLGVKNSLALIPNGIWQQEFDQLPDPEAFYQAFPETRSKTLILFLGRIDPKKGLDLLATAFAKIQSSFPQTHLIIAGPDNIGFLSTAKAYFSQLGCLNSVTFTGMLRGSLKAAAFAASSLYVAPSYSEGFSMSVLEGMACGLPCVITTGCNFPEAADAKAAQIVEINADEIANALLDCLHHPEQAKAMGDRARRFILQNYSWENITANLIEIYQGILYQHSTPVFPNKNLAN